MISKRIPIETQNDNYARLARYIASAGDDEKLLDCWCAGCIEDDYDQGITEVTDTQALNTRVTGARTYHLIVSFRQEDADKLSPERLRHIEARFTDALGWTEHQRHCGVHKNTGNVHLHIAYNMIHPVSYRWRKPFRDYYIRDRLCRELEQEYGLAVDHGREKSRETPSLPDKAAALEAHSGQESFTTYAQHHREAIMAELEQARGWHDLHQALARYGLTIKPHGNGLAIRDKHGKASMKASALDRSLSMKKLEARFGPYAPLKIIEVVLERDRYQAAPLHRSPERGKLFAEYRQGISERKARLEAVKEREKAALAAIRKEWADKRAAIEAMSIAKKNRRNLLALSRRHEAEALARARLEAQPAREAVRRDIPFTTWNAFLRLKAEHGNETALAVLRSKRETVSEEKEATPAVNWSDRLSARAENAARERAALETEGISGRAKTRLLAVARMESLVAEGAIPGFSHKVDNKGAVVFTLPGGGTIRDQGKALFFTAASEETRKTAMRYARKKWGKAILIEGNRIVREPERDKALEAEQHKGLER